MFRLLNKIYVLIRWLLVLGLVGVLYHNRSIFYPLVDLMDALRIRDGLEQRKNGEITGKATRVLTGDTFSLKDNRGQMYTVRLTGVEAPGSQRTDRAELLRAGQSKTNLGHLILSNQVRVELTYTNESRGALGMVYLGDTNINVVAVQTGIVRVKRDRMNGLPLKDRYALIRAERKAQKNGKSE